MTEPRRRRVIYRRKRPNRWRVRVPKCRLLTSEERLYYEWSSTKLQALRRCVLSFWFGYVEKRPTGPEPVIRFVGKALHYHVQRFFHERFQSATSFADGWVGYWMAITEREQASERPNRKPVPIAWIDFEKERGHWLGRGRQICLDFYNRNAQRRDTGIVRLMEQDFKIDWCPPFRLTGRLDRVDEYPDHVEIVDYKMRRFPGYELDTLEQPVFYGLAYEHFFRSQVFDGKPLTAIRIETLGTWGDNAYQEIRLPGEIEERLLYQELTSASTGVWSIRKGKQLPEGSRPRLSYFPSDACGNPVLWPRLPRDKHCEYCDYVPDCFIWVPAHQSTGSPDARRELALYQARERSASMPMQEVIRFLQPTEG